MNNTFFYEDKTEITPNLSETARYLGYKKSNPPEENIQKLIEKAAAEIKKIMTPQGVYEIFPLTIEKIENENSEQKKLQNTANSDKNSQKMSEFSLFEQKNNQNSSKIELLEQDKAREYQRGYRKQKNQDFEQKKLQNTVNLDKNSQKVSEFTISEQNNDSNFQNSNIKEKARITFADVTIISHDLFNNMEGCTKVALLGATIGPQVDAYIRKNQIIDPVYASICQATGAMYIEEVVNKLNVEIKQQAAAQGYKTRPRYSPGYGDIPLEAQKDFFRLLNCQRIGLTLMPTLIMAPEKSVTAYIGWVKV